MQVEFRKLDGQADTHEKWIVGDFLFCLVFTLELAVRMAAYKKVFILGREKWWNLFDTVVVASSIVEVVADLLPGNGANLGISVFRTVRVIRIVRIIRVASSMTLVRNFKTMFYAVLDSGSSVFSAFTLLFVIMFIFGVLFMDIVRRSLHLASAEEQQSLRDRYGSTSRALWTLIAAVTGGVDWTEIVHPLIDLAPSSAVLFLGFILCTSLGVMNVLNGIFVNAALQSSRLDRELATDNALRERSKLIQEIVGLFLEADADHTGTLSWDEFETFLQDDEVRAYFVTLDLDMSSLHKIFTLLDQNGSGELDLSEFIEGCVRLKGTAKTIDIVLLRAEINKFMHALRTVARVSKNDDSSFKAFLSDADDSIMPSLSTIRKTSKPSEPAKQAHANDPCQYSQGQEV